MLLTLASPQLQGQLLETVIVGGLLIAGLRFAFGLLPSWARRLVGSVTRGLVNLVLGTGNKGKA